MQQFLLLIHVLACIAIIVLVLLQHGKGADIGASFGGGASNTVFGSQGSGSFLMKLTASLAALFFATSLILGYMATHQSKSAAAMNISSILMPTPPSPQKTIS